MPFTKGTYGSLKNPPFYFWSFIFAGSVVLLLQVLLVFVALVFAGSVVLAFVGVVALVFVMFVLLLLPLLLLPLLLHFLLFFLHFDNPGYNVFCFVEVVLEIHHCLFLY